MLLIEQRIYAELIGFITHSLGALQRDAAVVARIDCLQSFARIARERNYVRPTLDDGTRIEIRQGRHPVIETLMPVGEEYIPNDLLLDDKEQQIVMITGPNMSGKSALLRQTALIILMAQMGSFVPAKAAHIGVVDKIFTRVGASDNISQGESTFMVEMLESASILNNVSDRSTSCWTKSDAVRAPTTVFRSPGRWSNTCTTIRRPVPRRFSRPTTTNSTRWSRCARA